MLPLTVKGFAVHVQVLFVVSEPANKAGVIPARMLRYDRCVDCKMSLPAKTVNNDDAST